MGTDSTDVGSDYSQSAKYYDTIYGFKNYADEVARLLGMLGEDSLPTKPSLLDVACGTGAHLEHFAPRFRIEGLDLCAEILEVARGRLPGVPLHRDDMTSFELGRTFDVVTCLFSSIGYLKTTERLGQAVERMAAHVAPGGALLIESWFTPSQFIPNTPHSLLVEQPDLIISRVNTSLVRDGLSIMDLHHLVATPDETTHFVERHELALFTIEEMLEALNACDLAVKHYPEGLIGRSVYVGRKRGE